MSQSPGHELTLTQKSDSILKRRFEPQVGEFGTPYPPPQHFDDELRGCIASLLIHAGSARPVSDGAWTTLGQMLGEFQFWTSMVNTGDVQLLEQVAKRANALSLALNRAEKAGLDQMVAKLLGPGSGGRESKRVLMARLRGLASLGTISPFSRDMHLDTHLYAALAEWWEKAGGRKSVRHDDVRSHLSEFISIALSALPKDVRPPDSPKTIERRLREAVDQAQLEARQLDELASALGALRTK